MTNFEDLPFVAKKHILNFIEPVTRDAFLRVFKEHSVHPESVMCVSYMCRENQKYRKTLFA